MINIKNLNFAYRRGTKEVFNAMDFNLANGVVCGLLGRNGTGKTTLLSIISGLLFAQKDSAVDVLGHNPRHRSVDFLEQVMLVPEEFSLPAMSVNEFARTFGRFYPNFSALQMHEILTDFKVSPAEKFNRMSFGQCKKAYIAFALACNTPLLLLDEPTNGLDIPSKASFRRVMASIASPDRSIIISTHQVRDLEEVLDAVIIIDDREILLNATVAEITRKLRFEVLADNSEKPLFEQTSIHGRVGVVPNQDPNSETMLDMELLFNATITSPQQIKEIFQ